MSGKSPFHIHIIFLCFSLATCVLGTPSADPNAARSPDRQRPQCYADKTLRYRDFIYNPDIRVGCGYAIRGGHQCFSRRLSALTGTITLGLTCWAPSRDGTAKTRALRRGLEASDADGLWLRTEINGF
jgi:hypothetical protein